MTMGCRSVNTGRGGIMCSPGSDRTDWTAKNWDSTCTQPQLRQPRIVVWLYCAFVYIGKPVLPKILQSSRFICKQPGLYIYRISANSFLGNYSIYEVKDGHNVETIWKFPHFPLMKMNSFHRNYPGNTVLNSWHIRFTELRPYWKNSDILFSR